MGNTRSKAYILVFLFGYSVDYAIDSYIVLETKKLFTLFVMVVDPGFDRHCGYLCYCIVLCCT